MGQSQLKHILIQVKENIDSKQALIVKTANLVLVAPSLLWTYLEMALRACYHSPAPCWGEVLVSAWCIYCSAMDTNEDPGSKNHKMIFLAPEARHHFHQLLPTTKKRGLPVCLPAPNEGPGWCIQHCLSSLSPIQSQSTEVWWEFSEA